MGAPANKAALDAQQANNPGRYTFSEHYGDTSAGAVFAVPARAFSVGIEGDLYVKLLGDSTLTRIVCLAGTFIDNLAIKEFDSSSTALRVTFFW